jgi:calcineurin-like phosphoesterase family protein
MANLFLVSDTHFGHQGMCQFLREDGTKVRPFDDVSTMDQCMIENWNQTIKPKDKVYHLGDVVINRKFLEILKQLNGEKILIKGNHDIFKLNDYIPYFKDIRGSHRLDNNYILSHIPLHPDSIDGGKINFHGHIHYKRVLLNSKEIDPKYLNLCVEHWNYKPVPFETAKKIALEQV